MGPLVDALLAAMAPLTDRPFALFGHSMGAYVAYELACRLEERGVRPTHLFVAGPRAPHLPTAGPPIHTLPDPDFPEAVRRRYRAIPEAVCASPN